MDFEGDLYGRTLRVEFINRQRGEAIFPSLAALLEQMHADVARARRELGLDLRRELVDTP